MRGGCDAENKYYIIKSDFFSNYEIFAKTLQNLIVKTRRNYCIFAQFLIIIENLSNTIYVHIIYIYVDTRYCLVLLQYRR